MPLKWCVGRDCAPPDVVSPDHPPGASLGATREPGPHSEQGVLDDQAVSRTGAELQLLPAGGRERACPPRPRPRPRARPAPANPSVGNGHAPGARSSRSPAPRTSGAGRATAPTRRRTPRKRRSGRLRLPAHAVRPDTRADRWSAAIWAKVSIGRQHELHAALPPGFTGHASTMPGRGRPLRDSSQLGSAGYGPVIDLAIGHRMPLLTSSPTRIPVRGGPVAVPDGTGP